MAGGGIPVIWIEGELVGNGREVRNMLAAAPGAFKKSIRRQMYRERKRYVGNTQRDGKIRKQLMRRGLQGKGAYGRKGKWPRNVARGFKGYVYNKQTLDNMTLRLGIGLRNPSKFALGLRMMDEGYRGSRVINSPNQMPIPVYRNIKKIFPGDSSKAFKIMSQQGDLQPVNIGGTTLWFHEGLKYKTRGRGVESKKGQFKKSALMFVGARSVKISPQFDFVNMLNNDRPRIVNRARRVINNTVRRLNRGTVYKGDFK